MKWLGLLLLAVNVAFLASALRAPNVATPAPPEPPAARSLELLAELPADRRPPRREPLVPGELPAGVAAQTPVEEPTRRPEPPRVAGTEANCYRLTGFVEERQASKVKSTLEGRGASVTGPAAEEVTRLRYWVVLPPSPTRAQALSLVERLKQAGLKDYYLIPAGENRNAISLGIFSSREAAGRRMRQLSGLNLKVRVEEVASKETRWSLAARWPSAPAAGWQRALPEEVQVAESTCAAPP